MNKGFWAMPQFFIKSKNVKDQNIFLDNKSDLKHLKTVLRCKIGDEILLIDDAENLYTAKISEISQNFIKLEILHKEKSTRSLKIDLTLFQSVLKSQAQDFVIQKTTEIGAKKIQPVISKYTVVKFENQKDILKKTEKWQKIAFESCKQCERSKAPEILPPIPLKEAIKLDFDIKIACIERNAKISLKEFLRKTPCQEEQKIALFIGPEGGWANEEIELFNKNNITKVSLGNMILRAETAVITALSGVVYEYEN